MDSLVTTDDALLGGRLRFRQPAKGYRAAIDPVLLAAAVDAETGALVGDFGCGAGAVSLCLAARLPDISLVGVEIDPTMAELARGNAVVNGMAHRFRIVTDDVEAVNIGSLDVERSFDWVVTNPPYHDESDPSPDGARARATALADLGPWVRAAHRVLRRGGRFAVILRADRMDEMLRLFDGSFGGVEILPLWPRAGIAAKRVILRAVKDSRAPLSLLPGLALHEVDGNYTAAAVEILSGGAALAARPGPLRTVAPQQSAC